MPRLRRLRDPQRGAGLHAGARHPAGEDRLRLRHRLRGALPVLHGDVRDALDPRARAGDRDRSRDGAAGSLGLGGRRRRRRALDRRQPPDPCAAPQRQPHDPAVQQPDLRAHEGPVLADLGARQGDEVDADGLGRPAVQPALRRDRRRGDVRRPRDRHRQEGADRGAARGGGAPRRGVRRDPPELQHLQRRRVRLRARAEGEPHLPRGGRADRVRRHAASGRPPTARPRWSTRPQAACSSTTRVTSSRASRSRSPGSPSRRVGAVPFGVFRSVERPLTTRLSPSSSRAAREQRGEGDLEALLHAGDTWQIG